ncbi:MAG: hypothetical protein AB1432_16115, partial [Bacteroidota bacterium]
MTSKTKEHLLKEIESLQKQNRSLQKQNRSLLKKINVLQNSLLDFEKDNQFNLSLENANLGIIIISKTGKIAGANNFIVRILGYNNKEL